MISSQVLTRGLAILLFCCTHVVFSFAADTVSPISSDTALPPGKRLLWGHEPLEQLSATRARMVLNGIWRFMPAVGATQQKASAGWGSISVPGAWHITDQSWRTGVPGVLVPGKGAHWNVVPLPELARAWYEREIIIPEQWQGQEITLNLARVCTDAVVFIDDKQCGTVQWPAGEVSLTPYVEPGQKALLRILVLATLNAGDGVQMRDAATAPAITTALQARGLVGDVTLEARPRGAHIDDIFIKPSVRRKELTIDVDLKDVQQAGPVKFKAIIRTQNYSEYHAFEIVANVMARRTQTVSLTWPWRGPKLWDFRRPNLYRLYLKAQGAGLADEYPERFGFREFRVTGRELLLNEKPFRLRPMTNPLESAVGGLREAIEGNISGAIMRNFNIQELQSLDHDTRGLLHYRELWATVADEKGWPLIYPALDMSPYFSSWSQPGTKEKWTARMLAEWKRIRNHPSIIILGSPSNHFSHGSNQNLLRTGNTSTPATDMEYPVHKQSGLESIRIIKYYDPTRPLITHDSGIVGDIHADDSYRSLLSLQEREDWLSAWAKNGVRPYMAIGSGSPAYAALLRGRGNDDTVWNSEPFVTEYSAIYFGARAYRAESKVYRDSIQQKFIKDQQYSSWEKAEALVAEPSYQMLQSLFIRNTWRAWRTWGIAGGMNPGKGHTTHLAQRVPFGNVAMPPFEPGRLGTYVRAVPQSSLLGMRPNNWAMQPSEVMLSHMNAPTFTWIAGRADAFTSKGHHFFPATRVQKQIVLINDQRSIQTYQVTWSVQVGSKTITSGKGKGKIGIGRNLFLPLEFITPVVTSKTDGKITLTARIGLMEHTDTFAFRIFPRPIRKKSQTVLVFDPAGDTIRMLNRLGWQTQPWNGKTTGQTKNRPPVLIIGRHALDQGKSLPGSLETFVAAGGRAIIFGQNPQWMRKAARFRVRPQVARRFFTVQPGHPIIKGLDEADFRDWRGNGSVSSASIEKPHHGGWRPLLEGEFDLAYSPLMELSYRKGLLIWCTLDLEGRTEIDPVTNLLTNRLLSYALQATPTPRAVRTVYLGGEDGEKFLQRIGLIFAKARSIPAVKGPAPLLVIGSDYEVDNTAFTTFLAHGGRALILARETAILPLGFKATLRQDFGGSLDVPVWGECRGLSASDLRLRTGIPATLLSDAPVGQKAQIGAGGLLGRLRVGNGVALFMQLMPDMLHAEKRTYLRTSAWRLTRTLSQLLANLGGQFETDRLSFQFAPIPTPATAGFYSRDFRADYTLGDNPYR